MKSFSQRAIAALMFVPCIALLIGVVCAISVAAPSSSIGPWPIQSAGIQGSGSFSITGTNPYYMSSNGTVATSQPCNWVCISVSTSTAKLSTTSSGALALPSGLAPFTVSCSNLNTLQVTGSNATVGYLYGN